jgi:hypothetical protein
VRNFKVGDRAVRKDAHQGGKKKYRKGYTFTVRQIVPDFEAFGAGHCYLVDDDGEHHADVACAIAEETA